MIGGLLILAGLCAVGLDGLFWWFGGRSKDYLGIDNRIWRRWISALFFPASMAGLAWAAGHLSWWHLAAVGLFKIHAHIGYGADDANFLGKLARRSLWACTASLACLPYAFASTLLWVWAMQGIVALIASCALGIANPFDQPGRESPEEAAIRISSTVFIPFFAI